MDADFQQVAILASGRDGELACNVLEARSIACVRATDCDHLASMLQVGVGVIIISEEALAAPASASLINAIQAQEPWSDLPIIAVARSAERSIELKALTTLVSMTILTRPMAIDDLVTAVQTGLRARKRQIALRDLLSQREEATVRRDVFLSMLAHELRNPLTPVRYAAAMLRSPDAVARLPKIAEVIERQVAHMAKLTDQLLDVSRLTHGRIAVDRRLTNFAAVVRGVLESYVDEAHAKSLRVDQSCINELWVDGDVTRLHQVVSILLANAVKFTPAHGSVMVSLHKDGQEAVLTVQDTGIGMSLKLRESLFEPFAQGESSLARTGGGMGLGLSIARGLMALHDGTLEGNSAGLGRGSTFTVKIPLSQSQHVPEIRDAYASPPANHGGLNVIIAEDNVDAAEALQMLLAGSGFRVTVIHDGLTAIEAIKQQRPDVLLCDVGLPGASGYEVALAVRASAFAPRLMIAVTGYSSAEDRQKALSSGFDLHLGKPVCPQQLLQILLRLCEGRGSQHN